MITIGAVNGFTALTKTSAYTAVNGDLVLADASGGAFTVTLPASGPLNMQVSVKKIDTSNQSVTVQGSGGALIDGDANCVIVGAGSGAVFAFDGTNWRILSTSVINTGGDSLQGIFVPGYTSGMWYDRRSALPFQTTTGSAAPGVSGVASVAVSSVVYVPHYSHRQVTIDNVGIMTGTSAPTAGSTVRIGLYANSANNQPGARLYDWGTVSPAAVTTAYSLAASGSIPRGWTWFALSFNATSFGSVATVGTSAMNMVPAVGMSTFNSTLNMWQTGVTEYYESGSGALPVTATPLAVVPSGAVTTPNVWYRVVS